MASRSGAAARSCAAGRRPTASPVRHADGTLEIPGEAITDPVRYTYALAGAAMAHGAEIRTGGRVAGRDDMPARVTVNCAGLYADEVARLFGDDSFEIYPRKGEFFVFDGIALERILLPTPPSARKECWCSRRSTARSSPGPTAHDQEDKDDWSVRPEAFDEVRAKAAELLPAIADAEPIASWAGLRPAGRGCNYVIGRSRPSPVNVAAIRSTGLTASLGIAEHVAELILPGVPSARSRRALRRHPKRPGGRRWRARYPRYMSSPKRMRAWGAGVSAGYAALGVAADALTSPARRPCSVSAPC